MKILFLITTLLTLTIGKATGAERHSICEGETLKSNVVLALKVENDKKCWSSIKAGETVDQSELYEKSGDFRFLYVFDFGSSDADPLMSIKYKRLRKKGDDTQLKKIRLFRDKMKTLCSDDKYFDSFEKDVSGLSYNRYHNRISIEGGVLNDYHVVFKNAMGESLKTSSIKRNLRNSFAVNTLFDNQNALVAFLVKNQFLSEAIAGKTIRSKYSELRVRIAKGAYAGSALSSSFSIPSGDPATIVVQDLSSRRKSGGLLNRITFKID